MDKYRLRKYTGIQKKIESLLAERSMIDTKLTASLTGMPRSGKTSDPTADAAGSLVDLSIEIDQLIIELVKERAEIELSLSALDGLEYTVMHRHYILGEPWEDVADYVGYTPRGIYKLHGRVLWKIRDKG